MNTDLLIADIRNYFERISARDRDKLARYIDAQFTILKELIIMTNDQLQAALDAVSTQLDKASTELVAEVATLTAAVAAGGGTNAAVDASVARLQAIAQKLDDMNADTPVVPTP